MLWKLRKKKNKKARYSAVAVGVLLALYAIIGFFVLPPIVKTQIEQRAGAALGRTVTVGKVRMNPFTLSLTLEQFDVRMQDGKASFLGWDRLYVNFAALKSFTNAWVLGEIELDGFHVNTVLKADGSLNFSDVLERLNAAIAHPATPAASHRPLRIVSLKVQRARVDFADESRSRPFTTTLGPVSFNLSEFQTAGKPDAPYHFAAITEAGEQFEWTGTLNAAPFVSTGELILENVLVSKYAAYYADQIGAEITEGWLAMRGRYEINLTEDARALKLIGGSLHLRALKVLERASKKVALELPALDISGVKADGLTRQAVIANVTLIGGQVHARREKDGTLNLLSLFTPPAGNTSSTSASATPLPDFTVGEVSLRDFRVDLNDLAAARPAELSLSGLNFSLRQVSLAEGAVMPLALTFNWAPQGTVKVAGNVAIKPALTADLQSEVGSLALVPISPYLEQFLNARFTEGTVSTAGRVQVSSAEGPAAVKFEGGLTLEKLALVDAVHNEPLAGFGSLTLNGLKAASASQLTLTLDDVNLVAPYVRVIVGEDKTLNLASVMKSVGGTSRSDDFVVVGESGRKAAPTTEFAPQIAIGQVRLSDGDFTLMDSSVTPAVRTGINQFGGTITGLSSENPGRGEVNLNAMVDGAGPISISGKLDPFGANRSINLQVDFKDVNLLPLSPYSGKYAGYQLARGKLGVDINFKLNGPKLESTNVITLNQFSFGAPVQSPDATKLPVRLGVALLKDLDGNIVIDVPVAGSLEDPSFRIGSVVLRVIVNLLTKAAVSPFALLGSMVGGGGEEMAFQEFIPGDSLLLVEGKPKLDALVLALTNRPGLNLGIAGGYDAAADTDALQRHQLGDLVRKTIWEERRMFDLKTPAMDKLVLTHEEEAAMVRKLYAVNILGGVVTSPMPGFPPGMVPTTQPPATHKTLFDRVMDVVTLRFIWGSNPKAAGPVPPPAEAMAPGAATEDPAAPSLEEMVDQLAALMTVEDKALHDLATARAQRVRDYLLNEGKIDAGRLILNNSPEAANPGARVQLTLQ